MSHKTSRSAACSHHRRSVHHQDPLVRADTEFQKQTVAQQKRQRHDKWVAEHQARTRFDHTQNRVRADLLINEARRLEKEHLQHQLQYARDLVRHTKRKLRSNGRSIRSDDATPPPKNGMRALDANVLNSGHSNSANCKSPDCDSHYDENSPQRFCACLTAPLCRQVQPKYRALALLKQTFEADKVEEALETLRETYASDHDMLEDLIYRYGPEDEDVSPNTRLRCVEERVTNCDRKWKDIGNAVTEEMRYRDTYSNVIRNLSIMRIFLEGSQASSYSCDTTERARRDAFHQNVLDQLSMDRQLFMTPTPRRDRR